MCLGGFVGTVPIQGVSGVFSEFQFQFRVSVGGAGGISFVCRECGVVGCISFGTCFFQFF